MVHSKSPVQGILLRLPLLLEGHDHQEPCIFAHNAAQNVILEYRSCLSTLKPLELRGQVLSAVNVS